MDVSDICRPWGNLKGRKSENMKLKRVVAGLLHTDQLAGYVFVHALRPTEQKRLHEGQIA
jgi:hypothetical protein